MPRSKSRFKRNKSEKEKKRSKAELQKSASQKSIKNNGFEMVTKGNFVHLKNTRTAEEHERILESMRENRPQMLVSIQNEIQEVVNIFEEYDNLKLLGGLAYNQLKEQNNPGSDGLGELILDYGLSFSTSIQGTPQKAPTIQIIETLIKRLEAIRFYYQWYILSEGATDQYLLVEHKLRFKMVVESLFIRGDGYSEHIYTLYTELFSGHDDFLKEKYGFTSVDILETILQLENSFATRLTLPNNIPHIANYNRFMEWSDSKNVDEVIASGVHFIDAFGHDNPDIVIKDSKVVSYPLNQISTYPELFKIRFRKNIHRLVVDAISQEFGDNTEFLNPSIKCFPLTDSKTTTKPVIKMGNDYYLFSFTLPTRNLLNITESLIKEADINYYKNKYIGNDYNKSRDNYLEEKAAMLFKKMIPSSQIFSGLKYRAPDATGKTAETELDILITSGHANYLIEVKAGGLSAPAKRGALERLTGQLKKGVGVGYGAFQSFRALNYILSNDMPIFKEKNRTITPVDKSKKIFRITVTMEHLSGVIANMYDLKEIGVIDNNVDFAWTCSIFDLMIFSEIIESEEDFIDFLEKRMELYHRPKMEFNDEIDILGHFLKHNLEFDEDKIDPQSTIIMSKFSREIDAFFEKGEQKPKRAMKKQ